MKNDKSLEIIFKDGESMIKPKGSITDVDLVKSIAMLYNTLLYNTETKDRVFKHTEAIKDIIEKILTAKLEEIDKETKENNKAHLTVVK
ncbi:hypothetical protein [Clostridium massiliamazoniense]|uniref:hypothetical protein n=1 Tax=Clostridium massiliamazoniense TaxID=1347366 RepID=UPI0006D7D648|nr:hypothetical protein [Clostridium massiliamazoniense]